MALGRTNINLTEIPYNPYAQIVNYMKLFDDGTFGEGLTATYRYRAYATNYYQNVSYSYNENGITLASKQTGDMGYQLDQNVDLTEYTIMSANVKSITNSTDNCLGLLLGTQGAITSGVSTSSYWMNTGGGTNYSFPSSTSASSTEKFTVGIKLWDISDVSLNLRPIIAKRSSNTNAVRTIVVDDWYLFKADDIATLAEKAGITASSIADILTASTTLLSNKDAVNFMTAQCTGDFMASAIASETFLTALNNSPYKSVVQSNEHWAKFLAMVA